MPRERTQFKPGQSGNPKGRPKGQGLIDCLAAEIAKKVPTGNGKTKKTQAELIAAAWIDHTKKGSVGHLLEMNERLYGKVPPSVPEPPFSLSELTEEAIQEDHDYRPDEPPNHGLPTGDQGPPEEVPR